MQNKGKRRRNLKEIEAIRNARRNSLFPRVKRLEQSDIDKFSSPEKSSDDVEVERLESPLGMLCPVPECSVLSEMNEADFKQPLKIRLTNLSSEENEPGRKLRKKRSAMGSMEDLWDESALEEESTEGRKKARRVSEEATVLKISIGKARSDTSFVRIPPKSCENEENLEKVAKAKAARKALKKAKKEAAQRRALGGASPSYLAGRSPGYHSPGHRRMSPYVNRYLASPPGFLSPTTPQKPTRGRKRKKRRKKKEGEKAEAKVPPPFVGVGKKEEAGLELAGQKVDSYEMECGRVVGVGDIVWGRTEEAQNWWPGNVSFNDFFSKKKTIALLISFYYDFEFFVRKCELF